MILLREAEGTSGSLGTAGFVTELERRLGRPIACRAAGRKAVAMPVGEQLGFAAIGELSPYETCYCLS